MRYKKMMLLLSILLAVSVCSCGPPKTVYVDDSQRVIFVGKGDKLTRPNKEVVEVDFDGLIISDGYFLELIGR